MNRATIPFQADQVGPAMLARGSRTDAKTRRRGLGWDPLIGLHLAALVSPALGAGGEAVNISESWVPATEQIGSNIALSMTIRNETGIADALLRVRCPVANFSEKHTVDRGEGAPAMRAIPSIPIAANSTTVLKADAYHVMLLQTRQTLAAGDAFNCAIVLQKAGTIDTEVKVRGLP